MKGRENIGSPEKRGQSRKEDEEDREEDISCGS